MCNLAHNSTVGTYLEREIGGPGRGVREERNWPQPTQYSLYQTPLIEQGSTALCRANECIRCKFDIRRKAKPRQSYWAGLDSNQCKLTLMGLQPIPTKSQTTETKQLTASNKSSVQTSVQTKTENTPKRAESQPQNLPPDLAEIVAVWPELPGHIRQAIRMLVQGYSKETE